MSIAIYLSGLTNSRQDGPTVDTDFVEKFVQSHEDLLYFNEFAREHPALGKSITGTVSWELYDTLYALSLAAGRGSHSSILFDTALLLCDEVRPKEMLLMVSEKLASCSETAAFELLLFTMQHVLLKGNNEAMWKQGLTSVLRKVVLLCGHTSSDMDAEGEEAEQEQGQSAVFSSASKLTAQLAIDFIRDLSTGLDAMVSSDIGASQAEKSTPLLIGFLLSLNAKVFLPLKDSELRHQYVTATTNLLISITGGNLDPVFRHIFRAKHAIFRHEYDLVKRAYLQKYCNRHTETCKEPGLTVALSTEDANSLLNRIAQSEYSNTLLRYFDSTTAAMEVGASTSCANSASSATATTTLGWEQAVCWDHVTDEHLAEILHTAQAAAEEGKSSAGTKSSITTFTAIATAQWFDAEGFCGAPELAWNISGIALLAHCALSSQLPGSVTNTVRPFLPLVHSRTYLLDLLRPYVLVLLRSNAASPEGLQMFNMLYGGSTAGSVTDAGGRHGRRQEVPIFMSFLAQQTVPTVLSHVTLSFYDSLSAFRSTEAVATGKVYWGAEDAAKLGYLAARANDVLSTAQTFITIMAGCSDGELRTKCFSSFRQYLKQLEERSLFGLLLVLVEHCPYPNMAGLLIDLAKECAQAASNGHSWSAFPSPTTIATATTTAAAACPPGGSTASSAESIDCAAGSLAPLPVPWQQEFQKGAAKKFPLKKLLKSKTAGTAGTSAAPASFDVGAMAVMESKRHSDPSTGGTSAHVDEDSFLDVRAGTTKIGADKLVEVREAAPFIWAGRSPFWSPLVLQRFLLEPTRELLDHTTPEKILECMDTVAARVNLAQYIVLKLLTDPSLCSTAEAPAQGAGSSAAAALSQALDEYLSGSAVNATSVAPGGFPYAFSKLRAVKDIYVLYFALKKLRKVVKGASKGAVSAGPAAAAAPVNPLDAVRLQVLEMNLEHVLSNLHTLCNGLYSQLLVVS